MSISPSLEREQLNALHLVEKPSTFDSDDLKDLWDYPKAQRLAPAQHLIECVLEQEL